MDSIVPILAVLGIGSITAAFISWRVAIANHRQAWINALRDDIATFLKELEAAHYITADMFREGADLKELEPKKRETRLAILFTRARIRLRLNRVEPAHKEFEDKLDALLVVSDRVPDRARVEHAVD